MNVADLLALDTDALVEVTEDIENPEADRRHKRDWRKQAVVSKGTQFRVAFAHVTDVGPIHLDGKLPKKDGQFVYGIYLEGLRYSHQRVLISITRGAEGLAADLLPKLRVADAPKTVHDLMKAKGVSDQGLRYVLARLVEKGDLTLDQVAEAMDER